MRRMQMLVVASILSLVGGMSAEAFWCGGPSSQSEALHHVGEHACYELFFNNSAATLQSGTVVVLDGASSTGVNEGVGSTLDVVPTSAGRNFIDVDGMDGDVTNVGTYITTTTSADDAEVAGVVDDNSCADQTYCRVQVYGPRLVRCADSTDDVTIAAAVGTTTVAGEMGGGNGLGVALTDCNASGNDISTGWVFIRIGGNL